MKVSTEFIVLHSTPVGDNSVVVHTISSHYGRKSFFLRNASRKTSLLLPLTIVEAEIVESSRSELYTISKMFSASNLIGIRNSMVKNAISMFMSEVLYRVIKDGCNEEGLYEWCHRNVLILNELNTGIGNFHIRFLLELTVVLGITPQSSMMQPFAADKIMLVTELMSCSFEESMLVPLNGRTRNELAEIILKYIEYYTESRVNVNSLKVLRELFV